VLRRLLRARHGWSPAPIPASSRCRRPRAFPERRMRPGRTRQRTPAWTDRPGHRPGVRLWPDGSIRGRGGRSLPISLPNPNPSSRFRRFGRPRSAPPVPSPAAAQMLPVPAPHTRRSRFRFYARVRPTMRCSDMALVGGSPGLGEAKPDPLPGVAHGAALRDVAGIGEHGDVLAEGGLADVEQGQQGAELDLAHGFQGRADPQPGRGVDQVVEPVRGRRRGRLGVVCCAHRRAARALSVSPVPSGPLPPGA
jgi:hypothetical protein